MTALKRPRRRTGVVCDITQLWPYPNKSGKVTTNLAEWRVKVRAILQNICVKRF